MFAGSRTGFHNSAQKKRGRGRTIICHKRIGRSLAAVVEVLPAGKGRFNAATETAGKFKGHHRSKFIPCAQAEIRSGRIVEIFWLPYTHKSGRLPVSVLDLHIDSNPCVRTGRTALLKTDLPPGLCQRPADAGSSLNKSLVDGNVPGHPHAGESLRPSWLPSERSAPDRRQRQQAGIIPLVNFTAEQTWNLITQSTPSRLVKAELIRCNRESGE